jgi:hypothetical protein
VDPPPFSSTAYFSTTHTLHCNCTTNSGPIWLLFFAYSLIRPFLMPPYSENALQGALNAVYSGDSVIHAAADYAVPKTTLLSRLQGRESYKTAHASRQRLSTAQEDHMVNWIRIQAALALPPSYA